MLEYPDDSPVLSSVKLDVVDSVADVVLSVSIVITVEAEEKLEVDEELTTVLQLTLPFCIKP